MVSFKVRYCKVQMARFVRGDLSEAARRRVGRYIDECEDCRREYLRHKAFAETLERCLPALGRPQGQRLDRVWSSLQREMQAPPPQPMSLRGLMPKPNLQFSYGLLVLAISVALLLPMALGFHATLVMIDLPPAPHAARLDRTPKAYIALRPPVAATAQPSARVRRLTLQNTPAPGG